MATERLQKLLAQWGVASRRQAEQILLAGRVRVNGEVVTALGTKADPERDAVELDGRPIPVLPAHHCTLLLNKPPGVISTCRDPQGRPTVLDLLPASLHQHYRLYPVGRLDAESSGALLLSNDGDLTLRLTHPRHHIVKTYLVRVQGIPTDAVLHQWRAGVELPDGVTLPAVVDTLKINPRGERRTCDLRIMMREGRNRQIRRIAAQLGHPVVTLQRIGIGTLTLGVLGLGEFRRLSIAEVLQLKRESDYGCS